MRKWNIRLLVICPITSKFILFNPWMHGTYMTHISKTPIMNTLFKILIRIRCKKIENDLPKLLQQENLYKDGD